MKSPKKPLYEVLGVKSDASPAELKHARRQERRAMEDGDTGRVEWIEHDLRRCLSIFRFARQEMITVRQAVDWLVIHPNDEKLPTEFIEAFGIATKAETRGT